MFRRNVIKVLLSPFALLYGIIISVINFFYDIGLLKASRFSVPVICVGNLTIGGAGKTPHIEYLIDLLKDYIDVATLSRGYKRETKGFRYVQPSDTALLAGDEPLQYKRKYPEIVVAVSESRAYAIPQILQQYPRTQAILLDDAFQHRAVKPGLSILLTAYGALFTEDYLLPSGRLREWRSAYKRADMIIVSKCPFSLTVAQKEKMIREINPAHYQKIYFSYYQYGYPYSFYGPQQHISLDKGLDVILLSAIANTEYLIQYLDENVASVHEIEFADHHVFDSYDIERIGKAYENLPSDRKLILTTEKDAMRLELHRELLQSKNIPVYILPAKVQFHFDEGEDFDKDIRNFLLSFEV
ncbi:MAG: tetraacyldisaccharide 4'-kinase [Saprospiraceae bacterium]|nr:tetraacyldisaccharide 4'-kinase [Saprospiraceae bacterium]MBK8670966.1 tetraacyldisaccharide 4'-kinase [Saprospiraceae bacterium]